jgi:uncharacterized membrane protein YqiK
VNTGSCCADKARTAAYSFGILGSILIIGGLVWVMRYYTQPSPADTARVAERRKASTEVNHIGKDQLDSYGYVDVAKGQVRLPIQQAMERVALEWRNPAVGRSNLLARLNQFNPPPPPKAPEKPSPFE